MSDLFKILDSICVTKKRLPPEFIEDNWVGGYMITRWISFLNIGDEQKGVLLSYLNTLSTDMFVDKYDQYLYYLYSIPQTKYTRYKYISKGAKKKPLKRDLDYEKVLKFLAESLEISKREAKYYIDEEYINFDNIKKSI